MPRRARLDAPGTLHHVIVRGIEKRKIVNDDQDRRHFVTRLGRVAVKTSTSIYAWVLMNNHAHLLVRSGLAGLPAFMRKLLTGYAVVYNLRHERHGHLFQNRYKSIVCEEDAYFRELVRYIHLNPIRAGVLDSVSQLDRYPWCGHWVLLGHGINDWQDVDYVLKWFGSTASAAKRSYRKYLKDGLSQGHRPDLVGGGLIRSAGGWSAVKGLRRAREPQRADERILGSSDFVDQIIKESEIRLSYQFTSDEQIEKASALLVDECAKRGIALSAVKAGSRARALSRLRADMVPIMVGRLGLSHAETARQLGISTSAISRILERTNKS